jgi:hypothetical protein
VVQIVEAEAPLARSSSPTQSLLPLKNRNRCFPVDLQNGQQACSAWMSDDSENNFVAQPEDGYVCSATWKGKITS